MSSERLAVDTRLKWWTLVEIEQRSLLEVRIGPREHRCTSTRIKSQSNDRFHRGRDPRWRNSASDERKKRRLNMEKIASRVEKKEYVQRTTGTRPTRAETMNTTTTGERTIAATFQSLSILHIEMEKSAQLPGGGWGIGKEEGRCAR